MPQREAVGCQPKHIHSLEPQLLQVTNHPCQHVHVHVNAEGLIQVRRCQPLAKIGYHVRAATWVPAGVAQIVHEVFREYSLRRRTFLGKACGLLYIASAGVAKPRQPGQLHCASQADQVDYCPIQMHARCCSMQRILSTLMLTVIPWWAILMHPWVR
jgi:hypothetical protein